MYKKNDIKKRIVVSAGILAVAVVGLLVAGYAMSSAAEPMTYKGTVLSIDSAAKTLTVQSGEYDKLSFNWKDGAMVTKCDKPVAFEDIKVGDEVTIGYEESGGIYTAGNIALAGKEC